jgi:hypothetical protein
MIAQLIEDHKRLRTIAGELRGFLTADHAPVDINFCRLRWMLVRELTSHLARERALFAPKRPDLAPADDPFEALVQRHMARWDFRAIQNQWRHYCFSAQTLLRRLDARMDQEESSLFPTHGVKSRDPDRSTAQNTVMHR